MTREQKIEYWRNFHRFQKRYEAIYLPKIHKAIQAQVNQYLEAGTVSAINSAPIYKVLIDLYQTVGMQWAHKSDVHRRRLKQRMPMGFSERILNLMKQYFGIDLLNLAEDITTRTKDIIRDILVTAAELGSSFDEITKMIKQSTKLGAKRARTIARTETVAAANAGAMVNAADTGLELNKVWISAQDSRTRRRPEDEFDHLHMNGVTIPYKDLFNVSGEYLSQPGDKSNGATGGNVINCRCCVAFESVD